MKINTCNTHSSSEINARRFWGQLSFINLLPSRLKMNTLIPCVPKCINTNTTTWVIQVHLSGKSKSKVSKKKWEKALMSLCFRAHVQIKSINSLWKRFSKIDSFESRPLRYKKILIWRHNSVEFIVHVNKIFMERRCGIESKIIPGVTFYFLKLDPCLQAQIPLEKINIQQVSP